jgi:hypothetical protein
MDRMDFSSFVACTLTWADRPDIVEDLKDGYFDRTWFPDGLVNGDNQHGELEGNVKMIKRAVRF